MRKEYNKLIRDRIPEMIAANGNTAQIRVLSDEEYADALERKLTEEVSEYLESWASVELADVLEVIEALAENAGVSFDELLKLKAEKRRTNGAFQKKLFLEFVEDKRDVLACGGWVWKYGICITSAVNARGEAISGAM